MLRKLSILIIAIVLLLFSYPQLGIATEANQGEKIFNIYCAGCHPNGNNIIRRAKSLKKAALKKYKRDSIETISELVTYGKNNMSAFKDRLSEEKINAVAKYVLEQAENNWK